MKKRIARLSADYPPLRLWLDDLEKIEEIVRAWAKEVKFRTTDAEFDSISELRADVKQNCITELHIESDSPYATVELSPIGSRVWVSGSDDQVNAGVFYSINEILKRRVRRLQQIVIHPGFFAACSAIVFAASAITGNIWFVLSLLPAVVIWGIDSYIVRLKRHSIIRLEHRGSSRSYWQRNRGHDYYQHCRRCNHRTDFGLDRLLRRTCSTR